jgi:hypothetical protein
VPTVEFPPWVPLTSHATEVLVVPLTEALNWEDAPVCNTALVGEIETATGEVVELFAVKVIVADAYAPVPFHARTVTWCVPVDREMFGLMLGVAPVLQTPAPST